MQPRVIMTHTPQSRLSECDTKSSTYGCEERVCVCVCERETEVSEERKRHASTVLRVAQDYCCASPRAILPCLGARNYRRVLFAPGGVPS